MNFLKYSNETQSNIIPEEDFESLTQEVFNVDLSVHQLLFLMDRLLKLLKMDIPFLVNIVSITYTRE